MIATANFWCDENADVNVIVKFFIANLDPSYISHSELMLGRASSPTRWSEDLPELLTSEISSSLSGGGHSRVAASTLNGELAAIAIFAIAGDGKFRHGVLEDLVVHRELRGQGIGGAMVRWLLEEARASRLSGVFLESGVHNEHGKAFFSRNGFVPCSTTFFHELP